MTRFSILIALLLSGAMLHAQTAPLWIDDSYRALNYPSETWYVGYSQDRVSASGDLSKALDALKLDARNRLSESILVSVSGKTKVMNSSRQEISGGRSSEVIGTEYRQELTSATESVLANLATETWHDSRSGAIYAFVCVRKADLENFYSSRIDMALGKAASLTEIARQYEEVGKVSQAKERLTEAVQILEDSEYWFMLLAAVNANSPVLGKYEYATGIYREINATLSTIGKGPVIFIESSYSLSGTQDDAFRSDPRILERAIAQALSESGFQISDGKEQADYILTMVTSTSERSRPENGFGLISFYANAEGTLVNGRTGKELATFSIFRESGCFATGSSPENAATKAFKSETLKNMIIEKITKSIDD